MGSVQKQDKKTERIKKIRGRIWELDFLRGICIILLVLDHAMITISSVFYSTWRESTHPFFVKLARFAYQFCAERLVFSEFEWIYGVRNMIRPWVVAMFFVLCGISCAFSRSNLKRGIKLAMVAMIYTGLSYLIEVIVPDMSGFLVMYGVLHMLATCILLFSLIELACRKDIVSALVALALGCFIFFFLDGYLASLPSPEKDSILSIIHVNLTAYGLRQFSPGDYFPLIPNFAFFLWGVFFGKTIYRRKKSLLPFLDGKWNRPILFLGRHTLLIYVLHVAIISGILALLTYIWIVPGNWY